MKDELGVRSMGGGGNTIEKTNAKRFSGRKFAGRGDIRGKPL